MFRLSKNVTMMPVKTNDQLTALYCINEFIGHVCPGVMLTKHRKGLIKDLATCARPTGGHHMYIASITGLYNLLQTVPKSKILPAFRAVTLVMMERASNDIEEVTLEELAANMSQMSNLNMDESGDGQTNHEVHNEPEVMHEEHLYKVAAAQSAIKRRRLETLFSVENIELDQKRKTILTLAKLDAEASKVRATAIAEEAESINAKASAIERLCVATLRMQQVTSSILKVESATTANIEPTAPAAMNGVQTMVTVKQVAASMNDRWALDMPLLRKAGSIARKLIDATGESYSTAVVREGKYEVRAYDAKYRALIIEALNKAAKKPNSAAQLQPRAFNPPVATLVTEIPGAYFEDENE